MKESISAVELLPPETAGKILRNGRFLAGDSIPLILGMSGFALIFAGYFFTRLPPESRPPDTLDRTLLWIALTLILAGLLFHRTNREFLSNVLLLFRTRREIRKRPDRIIDPNDPDAWFVEQIAQKHWQSPTWNKATDIGLLKVDAQNEMLLFEGDRMRFRIAGHYIVRCDQDFAKVYEEEPGISATLIRHWLKYFFAVLVLREGELTHQISFRVLARKRMFTAEQAAATNKTLVEQIHQIQKGGPAHK